MTPTGTVVLVGGEHGGNLTGGMNRSLGALLLTPFIRQRFAMYVAKERASDLERLAGFFEAGTVVPSLGHTFPLDRVPEAMRLLDSGRVRGKVAITTT
ncbi:zinc-binding dehydrogenase [Nocardioides sp. NPDC058538]|uniref:zinc-binding dehydrogenase n=1 Tax=Nocardioides sp. NPDC058538 TaxID=3346542 RepID=UPI0036553DE1